MFQRMKHVSKLAAQHKWEVVQELPHPLLSSTFAPSSCPSVDSSLLPQQERGEYSETTSLLLESSDSQSRMELLFNWNKLTVTKSSLKPSPTATITQGVVVGGVANGQHMDTHKWASKTITLLPTGKAVTNLRGNFIALFTSD